MNKDQFLHMYIFVSKSVGSILSSSHINKLISNSNQSIRVPSPLRGIFSGICKENKEKSNLNQRKII